MKNRRPGHKRRARAKGQLNGIKGRVDIAIRRGGGADTTPGQRRELAACHAVNTVVHDDGHHIDIAAAGMNKMIAAYGHGVTIAHGNENRQVGTGHLDARSKSQSPSVQGVHTVEIHVSRNAGRAADAGHHAEIVLRNSQFINGMQKSVENDAMAAAGTPDMREKAFPDKSFDAHYSPLPSTTRITSPMSSGVIRLPSTRLARKTRFG